MMCLKCGNEIKDNEQICSNCGHNKNNIINEDNAYATVNRGIYNPNAVKKEEADKVLEEQKQFDEMLQAYIGSMYYNFKKGKFSWCAFFLSHVYFFYRKLYAVGAIVLLGNMIINFIFRNNVLLLGIIGLIYMLFLGLTFKKFYFNECIERVAKIKKDYPNKGFNELMEIARRKGGVNKVIIIPFILAYILLLILFIIGIIAILSNYGII